MYTVNIGVTLSNEFLLMQVIYSCKTKASQPSDFKFPPGFCVNQNPQHWSCKEQTLKLMQEVIKPYSTL